jgi:hypothetical protein
MIGGREPAAIIGIVVTVILGVVTTLAGEGVISDALQGRITDLVNAVAQLLVLLAPLITGLLIRPNVTPSAAPVLPAGQTVIVAGTGEPAKVTPV